MDLAHLKILLGILPQQKHLVTPATLQWSSVLVTGAHAGFRGTKVDRRSVFIAGNIILGIAMFSLLQRNQEEGQVTDTLFSLLPMVESQDFEAHERSHGKH